MHVQVESGRRSLTLDDEGDQKTLQDDALPQRMCRLLLWERRRLVSVSCWEHNSKDQELRVGKTEKTILMVRLDDAGRRGQGPIPAEAWRGGNDHPGGRFHHGTGGGRGRTPRTPTATVTPVPRLQREDREVREG